MYFMQKGITIFRWKIFVSQYEKFRRANRMCLRKFRVSKNFMPKRGISRFSIKKNCCLTVPKILRRGTLLCFRNFLVSKKLMDKRGEGRREYHDFPSKNVCLTVSKNLVGETFSVSLISGIERFYASEIYLTILCRNFFCLSAEKFRRGTFLICVSEKNLVSKKIMDKRGGEGGGSITIFSRKFCLTIPKNLVRESYCFWEIFWFRNVLCMKRGVSRFSVQNFWSHSAKIFRGHPFNVPENLGYRKILCITGGITFFRRIMMVSQSRKSSRTSPQNFRKLGYRKILCIIVSQFSVENISSQGAEKFRRGNLQCVFH